MNVSSVKNLNGETFSAVQDADLTTVVQTNSGNWNDISAYQTKSATYMPSGKFISAKGLDQIIRGKSTTSHYIGFKIPDSTIDTPAVYLQGQFGSAYYKENELKLGRSNMTIAFNIGGGGPKISAGGTGTTAPSYLYLYNSANSATLSQSRILLSSNDSTSGLVDIPSISAWNDTTDVVQTNSATWGQGGGGGTDNSNTFTIISGVTTNKEVAENSGKGLLFRDGRGYTYNFAGKTTYSNYAIYDFRAMTAGNTCKQCRVKVYPTAESATTAYTTGYTTMLTTNDTATYANIAYTAYYDHQGHNIAGLYNFVSQNSGSWTGGGGGDTGTSIPLRIDYQFSEQYGSKYTDCSLSSDGSNFLFTAYDEGHAPTDLFINGNNYQWTFNNGRWEIPHQIFGKESIQWPNSVGLQYSGQDIIEALPASHISTSINKVVVNNTMGSITGNIDLACQGVSYPYTAFTGSWSGEIPTSFNNMPVTSYNVSVGPESYGNDYSYVIGAYSEAGGTTINSADVFPSTDNLQPGATYRLCWNTNNGGLYWEQGGN